jgi:hypothetical protein
VLVSGWPERPAAYREFIAGGSPAGYAADDGAALHFHGAKLKEVVTSRPEPVAYRVQLKNGRVVERSLATRYLGA